GPPQTGALRARSPPPRPSVSLRRAPCAAVRAARASAAWCAPPAPRGGERWRSLVPHPRLEAGVRTIHREVDQHVDSGDAEHHSVDYRIVTAEPGGDAEA